MGTVTQLPQVPQPTMTLASEMRAERLARRVIDRWTFWNKEQEGKRGHYEGTDD
jgi:hypothetical protein